MKKLLVLGIMCLMFSVTLVSSAKYQFDYELPKPINVYELFRLSRGTGEIQQCTAFGWSLLTNLRFYQDKLYHCEVALEKQYARSCGGSKTITKVVDNTPDYSQGDMNGDCNVDLGDLARAGDIVGKVKSNYGKTVC